jgi:hypothetical protein
MVDPAFEATFDPSQRCNRDLRGRNMRRKLVVILMTLACICAGSTTALAAPNGDHASCEAILTSPDAHNQIRDDLAQEVREFAAEESRPPGDIYKEVAHVKGATEECLALGP